jgi:hypothetical protein
MYERDIKMLLWLNILKIDKRKEDIGKYKKKMLDKIEKVYEEV